MEKKRFVPGDPTLTEEELATLASVGDTISRPRGTVFMVEGESSDFVLVILKGYMKVLTGEADKKVPTGEVGKGYAYLREALETVGETASRTGKPRGATVTAMTDVTVLWLTGEQWESFLDENPRALRAQLHLVDERLAEADQKARQSDFSVERKLAQVLLKMTEVNGVRVDHDSIEIATTQEELAQLTGLGIDSIKKATRTFRASGLLATGVRRMTLKNLTKIRAVAERGIPLP